MITDINLTKIQKEMFAELLIFYLEAREFVGQLAKEKVKLSDESFQTIICIGSVGLRIDNYYFNLPKERQEQIKKLMRDKIDEWRKEDEKQ